MYLVENKDWLFSGLAIAVISISANWLTKAILVSRIITEHLKNSSKITIKVNGVEISGDTIDAEQLRKKIMEVTGNDFVDPELPNKANPADAPKGARR